MIAYQPIYGPLETREVYQIRLPSLVAATLVRRYKRFLCDVLLSDGSTQTCYICNPGSMLGMCPPGAPVRLTRPLGSKRKYEYSVLAVKVRNTWVGCDTSLANMIVNRGLSEGWSVLAAAMKCRHTSFAIEPGFQFRGKKRRADFLINPDSDAKMLEVKCVTMASDWFQVENELGSCSEPKKAVPDIIPNECLRPATALFPDCQSKRAQEHLDALVEHRNSGLLFVVLRDDVTSVGGSQHCDPTFSNKLQSVLARVPVSAIRVSLDVENPDRGVLNVHRECLPIVGLSLA